MPLLWLSIAFLLGILLAAGISLSGWIWVLLAFAALIVFILAKLFPGRVARLRQGISGNRSIPPRPPFLLRFAQAASRFAPSIPYPLLFLSLFLGAWRYQSVQPQLSPDSIAWYNGREGGEERWVAVEGVLSEPVDVRDRYDLLTVRAERIWLEGEGSFRPVHGFMLARVQPGGEWRYGDRLRVGGALVEPAEGEKFSYKDYLARQGIHSMMEWGQVTLLDRGKGSPILAVIYDLQRHAFSTIYRIYPDPEASLLAGILLGIDSGIPDSVEQAFQATGTAHIVAISGFNITLLAGLFISLFGRLLGERRRVLSAVLTAACIAIYTVLVGATASVIRAALMGGLALFARQIGRRQDGLNSLAFVAALMAVFNPLSLWDPGFQLSFTATLGLVLYAEPLTQAFVRFSSRHLPLAISRRLAGPVSEYFLFTLAAQLLSLPVTMYHFHRISLVSVIANPLILPAQPAVMVLGGLAVILGMVFLPVGRLVGALAWPFVAFTIRAVELLARIPGGSFALGELSLTAVVLIYLLIIGWTWAVPRLQKAAATLGPSAALLALGSMALLVWQAALAAPDGRLHVTVLDVGMGDGILVQSPGGRYLLVDGGSSPSQLSEALGRRLPLAQRTLGFLVVAAGNGEQVGALPDVLERFPPQNVLWAGPTQGTYATREFWDVLGEEGIPVTQAESGHRLDLGQGAGLRVLYAGERGAVLLLEWKNFRLLLPAGVDFEAFQALENGRAVGRVTALLLADGGYAPSNPPEWFEALNPQLILLSVGIEGKRALPSPETLEAAQGYPLLRTDRNGWIHLTTDGERMWVEVERK